MWREKGKAKLQATEMNVVRRVAGVTRLDCIRNYEIRQRLQQRSIVEVMKEIINWTANVIEKPGSLVRKVLAGEVEEDLRGDLEKDGGMNSNYARASPLAQS